MNRILAGAAMAAALLASPAFAATTTPAKATPVDYSARCTTLADQWKTAETANAANASLGKAKADAVKGEKMCKSKKASDKKKGAADYESALKLLGVTPN